MFSAPHTQPGGARKHSYDAAVAEDLNCLRESKSRNDHSAFQATQEIIRLSRDQLREMVPELMGMVRDNPNCLPNVNLILGQFFVPPFLRQSMGIQEASRLMPYLQDNDLGVRLLAAWGVAIIMRNESPPEVLHAALQGLTSKDEESIQSALSPLSNMLSDGTASRSPVDSWYSGTDAQELVTALKEVAKNSDRPQSRALATELLIDLGHDGMQP